MFLPCYCTFSHRNNAAKGQGQGVKGGSGGGLVRIRKGRGEGVKQCRVGLRKRGRLGTLCQLCIRSFSYEVGFLGSAEHLLDLKWEASDSFTVP